jgi:hypothetical protein
MKPLTKLLMLLSAICCVLCLCAATQVGGEGFGNSFSSSTGDDNAASSLSTTASLNPAISTSAAVHIADLIQGKGSTF